MDISNLHIPFIRKLHQFTDVPGGFRPWTCGLSPSALYNCSLGCRKKMLIRTPEVKWISIKRWMSTTGKGETLPPGVFLAVKRKEEFQPLPKPVFAKTEYTLIMLPYGNVWSQYGKDNPITEEWLLNTHQDMTMLERLIRKDAAHPVHGYFLSCFRYMKDNPDQIGIHLKRKRRPSDDAESSC